METENRDILKKQQLEVFGILKEALTLPYKNINFIIFITVISFPLLCFLIYYESFLLRALVEASDILAPRDDFNYSWPLLDHLATRKLIKDFAYKLIQLGLLYLLPLHLLELFTMLVTIDLASTMLVTIDLASKINTEDRRMTLKRMTLKQMIDKPIYIAKLRCTFITSAYVLFLTTCTLLGLIWLGINYYVMLGNFISNALFAGIYGAAFIALLTKYFEWSAQWNMSIVISILEEIKGVEALALSAYFNRGSEKRGRVLMLVFFVWGLGLRVLCLLFGWYESGNRMVLPIVLYSLGSVIKWVACMVYFYDCKQRILEK